MVLPFLISCVADVNEPPEVDGANIIFAATSNAAGVITAAASGISECGCEQSE